MKKNLHSILMALSMCVSNVVLGQVKWTVMAELPDTLGVAGAFAGVSVGRLMVAGGANFPFGMPWTGGKKVYHSTGYVWDGVRWDTFELSEPVAYGASASVRDGVVCIGGEGPEGVSGKVFLYYWEGVVFRRRLPDLPEAVTNASATVIGERVYVAGGENSSRALKGFYMLDMADVGKGWRVLPVIPLALSNAVVVAQAGRVYVIGGRTKTSSGVSELHRTVFYYDTVSGAWHRGADLPTNWSAGTGVAVGSHGILLAGGDDGRIFHKIETLNAAGLVDEKIGVVENHPGFCRTVLYYDVLTDSWKVVGELPVPAQVTTTAVMYGQGMVIPSGEVKPGRRTRDIMFGKFEFDDEKK